MFILFFSNKCSLILVLQHYVVCFYKMSLQDLFFCGVCHDLSVAGPFLSTDTDWSFPLIVEVCLKEPLECSIFSSLMRFSVDRTRYTGCWLMNSFSDSNHNS